MRRKPLALLGLAEGADPLAPGTLTPTAFMFSLPFRSFWGASLSPPVDEKKSALLFPYLS